MTSASSLEILRTNPLMLIMMLLCSFTYGKVIYVDDDAAGTNDGSSWENAYVYLQDALADVNSTEKPVEILVAQGIYKPDQGAYQTPGDREATFRLINGVTLIGGYAGLGEPDPNTRDIELYETILSGDLNGDDAQVDVVEVADLKDLKYEPTRMENSYHVITGSGTDDSAVLDGFTITAGNANGPEVPNDDSHKFRSGAGMYNVSGSPIVANCIFTMNSAFSGGGMFNYDCSVILINCSFSKNFSYFGGGGMYNNGSRLILTDCTFSENMADDGGGICNYGPSMLKLTDCTFIRNSSDWNGGGMDGGIAMLTNCAFIDNEAGQGAGLFWGLFNLTNCSFIANKAKYWGGGMWSASDNVSNCTFSGNSAGVAGGAIFIFCSELNLTNCTLTGNSSPKGNALASDEFHGDNSNVEITNCIFWGSNNEIWNDTGLATAITISYSDIQGGQVDIYDPCGVVIWGQGNIDADPLFTDPGYWVDMNDPNIIVEPSDPNNESWVDGDYHLKSEAGRWNPVGENWVTDDVTSPCIDAGDPNSPVKDEPEPNGGIINMGAYGGTVEASKSPSGIHVKYNGGMSNPYDPAVNAAVVLEGLGTAQQPYLIRDANELGTVWFKPRAHYRLEADLDLSGITWTMAVVPWFGGTFDGNGHVISNLNIHGAGTLGLFGILDSGAIVSNLGMELVDIDGTSTGGLVGYSREGSIASCYSTGKVSGVNNVGGLVGYNYYDGSITSSYSNCTVIGYSDVGGLIGHNRGNITASYSTGKVTGDEDIGGLVGLNILGFTSTSFWDVETSGQHSSAGGAGLTTNEMQDINTFLNAGWDFVDETSNGTCDYWQISSGDYPRLQNGTGNGTVMLEGLGTAQQPYLIRDAGDLGKVWLSPTAHYRLDESVDLSGITWSVAVVPSFGGTFDGNGHIISNLHIQGGEYLGLFGQLYPGAIISDLGMEEVDVNGTGDYVGGLVGCNNKGSISTSFSNGIINGYYCVGGLVGYNNEGSIGTSFSTCTVSGNKSIGGLIGYSYYYSSITSSHSNGTVNGNDSVGGLVGSNSGSITSSHSTSAVTGTGERIGGLAGINGGIIATSYSTGTISGHKSVGGLVGANFGHVTTCYSTGAVSGVSKIGGLIGTDYNSYVSMCFWDTQTSGQATSDGGMGKTTAEMQTALTFLEAGWDFVDETANGTEDIWWILEGQDYPKLWWENEGN